MTTIFKTTINFFQGTWIIIEFRVGFWLLVDTKDKARTWYAFRFYFHHIDYYSLCGLFVKYSILELFHTTKNIFNTENPQNFLKLIISHYRWKIFKNLVLISWWSKQLSKDTINSNRTSLDRGLLSMVDAHKEMSEKSKLSKLWTE